MRGYGLARRRARFGGERSRRPTNQCAGVKSFGVVHSDQRGTHDRAAHPEAHPLRRVRKTWCAGTRDSRGKEMAAYKYCGEGRRFDELVFTLPPSRLGLLEQDACGGPSGLFLKPMASTEQGRG